MAKNGANARHTVDENHKKKYMKESGIRSQDLKEKTKEELRAVVKEWDTGKWKEVHSKTTLEICRTQKKEIKEETFNENCTPSIIFYKARTNCLPHKDRKRHSNEDTKCKICNQEDEDLAHFLLVCQEYAEERRKTRILQQPYQENRKKHYWKFFV